MSQTDPFSGITAFIRAAQYNSFSVAARSLGLTPSAVSKTVSRLEEKLGVKLFHRSPRAVTLTSVGEGFYQRCGGLLATVEDARAVAAGNSESSKGHLRIALPTSYAQQVVAPQLPTWQRENPQTSIEIILSDRHVDLVRERFDLAVRFDHIPDSRLVAKKLPSQTFITAASREYLERQGTPLTVGELVGHRCLAYVDQQTNLPRPWTFYELKSGRDHRHRVNSESGLLSNQGTFLLNIAIAHGGIIHAPDYLLKGSIDNGQLLAILEDYQSSGPNWWLVYPYSRHPHARLRRFLDFMQGL